VAQCSPADRIGKYSLRPSIPVATSMRVSKTHDDPLFDLSNGRIEVWHVKVAAPDILIHQLAPLLSSDENDRAARFQFARHRNAFVVVRGVLRGLLARYTGVSPADVIFEYGPNGKPSLPGSKIEFNISHTQDIAVLAFTQGCALGIDVECIRPVEQMMQIAARFFSPAEAQELAALPEEQRERAFFLCWTRKEAYIKAVGNGLSMPLNEFQVTLKENEPARFVRIGEENPVSSEWILHNLDLLFPAYAAAIAYRGAPKPVVQSALLPATLPVD
jgi:4'-phosphopantetheinyl transferase